MRPAAFITLAALILTLAPVFSVAAQDELAAFKGEWVGRWNFGPHGGDAWVTIKEHDAGKLKLDWIIKTDQGTKTFSHFKDVTLNGDTLVMKTASDITQLNRPSDEVMTGGYELTRGQFKGERGTYRFTRKK